MQRRTFLTSVAGTVAIVALDPVRAFAFDGKAAPLARSSADPARYVVVNEHVAFAPDGTLYVFQPQQHLLEHRGIGGKNAVGRIAQLGTKPGELNFPTAIAFDGRGRIYVADRGNHRINVYSPAGRFVSHIDRAGEARFAYPRGLAIDAENMVYVADSGMHRVHAFDAAHKFVRSFEAETDPVKLTHSRPAAVAVAPDGRIHVADSAERCIEVYERTGKLVARYGEADGLRAPSSLAMKQDGTTFVADPLAAAVFIFDAKGVLKEKFVPKTAEKRARVPRHLSLDKDGLLYVTGTAGHEA